MSPAAPTFQLGQGRRGLWGVLEAPSWGCRDEGGQKSEASHLLPKAPSNQRCKTGIFGPGDEFSLDNKGRVWAHSDGGAVLLGRGGVYTKVRAFCCLRPGGWLVNNKDVVGFRGRAGSGCISLRSAFLVQILHQNEVWLPGGVGAPALEGGCGLLRQVRNREVWWPHHSHSHGQGQKVRSGFSKCPLGRPRGSHCPLLLPAGHVCSQLSAPLFTTFTLKTE